MFGFTLEDLYDLSTTINKVDDKSRIIPLFAPADFTQILTIDTSDNCLRIFEHRGSDLGDDGKYSLNITRIKKINC